MRKSFVLGCSVALFATFGTAHAQDWTKSKWGPDDGVVAVGADTWAVEVIPFESKNVFEVHQILLPMSRTYILENMNTAPLAADKAYEFLFVLGAPKITGAVQSIINPVAIR